MIKLFDDDHQEERKARKKRKGVKVVGTQISEEMYNLLEENLPKWGYVSISDYLRDLIRRDLKEKGLIY